MPVAKRVRDGKVTWRARWRDDRGEQHSKSFRRKVDAERFMTQLERARLSGAYVDPGAGKMTVEEWSAKGTHSQVQLKPRPARRTSRCCGAGCCRGRDLSPSTK